MGVVGATMRELSTCLNSRLVALSETEGEVGELVVVDECGQEHFVKNGPALFSTTTSIPLSVSFPHPTRPFVIDYVHILSSLLL